MHVFDSSCTWFIYNLNRDHCYSQIICTMNMHAHMSSNSTLLTHPLPCLCFIPLPLHLSTLPFYLLEDPFSCARGVNIHPSSSLVIYQLFSPCCLTHPEDTPQIKLHIYIDDINISRSV
jgi:hypothetical protein